MVWFCTLCALVLVFCSFAPDAWANEFPYTAYSTASLRIRRLPKTDSAVLYVMVEGDAMTVMGESGDFLIIEYEGVQGFVQKTYVTRTKPDLDVNTLPVSQEAQALYILLSNGSKGVQVRALQQALEELGFYTSSVDGLYGKGTERAVSAFQTANDILADGVASAELQDFLYENEVKNAKGKDTQVLTLPPIEGYTMRLGRKGDAVVTLQTRLAELGYYTGTAHGTYDAATMAAVRAFQRKTGLDADGLAGKLTQDALYASGALDTVSTATPAPVITATPAPTQAAVYPYATYTLDSVNMRKTPSLEGRYMGVIPSGAAITVLSDEGDFLRVTYEGETVYVLETYVYVPAVYLPTATPTPAATLPPTAAPVSTYTSLSKGASGALVRALQQALAELGFYTITIDSDFGAGTENAVKAFQSKNGLEDSGVATPETQELLYEGKPKNTRGVKTDVKTLPPIDGVTIRPDDRGDAVVTLKTRLAQMGYYTDAITDIYDAAAQTAVRAFQRAHGLNADGVAGARTLAKLYAADAIWLLPSPTPSVSITPAPTMYVITPETVIVMQRGTRGLAVRYLQEQLIALHYLTSEPTGVYDTAEIAAVKAFQKAHGLHVDGIAGYETQSLLYSGTALDALATPTPAPTATPTITPPAVTESLKLGSTGSAVISLQTRLGQLGYLSGNVDGIFGAKTYSAVKAFQKRNSLNADGIAGESTISKLYSSSAVPAEDTTAGTPSPTPSATETTLEMGDQGDEVERMQVRLIELKYLAAGSADGVFGTRTYIAVKSFQSHNSLSVDGRAGPKTLEILYSSSAKGVDGSTVAPTPTPVPVFAVPNPADVRYANWYTEIRALAREAKYCVIYDFKTGLHWNIHMFSFGKHADSEPVTAQDTATMNQSFGKTAWIAHPVWVIFPSGRVYIAAMHNVPHLYGTINDNDFDGHLCIHFPRIMSEAEGTGPWAVTNQEAILAGWEITQAMINMQ